jgi:prepilin-type processing-associated H-X9-DG protein
MMYINDYDDKYPNSQRNPTLAEDPVGDHPVPWHYVVNPYVKNGNDSSFVDLGTTEMVGGVWNCPDFPSQKNSRDYGINIHLAGDMSDDAHFDYGPGPYDSITEGQVTAVASKVLIVEKGYMGTATGTGTDTIDWADAKFLTIEWAWAGGNGFDLSLPARADTDEDNQESPWPWSGSEMRFRHNTMTNIVWADGHVKTSKLGPFGGSKGWCTYLYNPTTSPSWYPYQTGDMPSNLCAAYGN